MRSRSAALFAVVIGCALVAGLGLAWNRARRVTPRELELPSVARASEPEPKAVAVAQPLATSTKDAGAPEPRGGALGDEELTGTLKVVFAGDQRPAAGADVYWFGSEQLADGRWRDDLDELGMGLPFFERNGRHFVTDAAGIARVPSCSGRIQVVATTPTHFGMTTLELREVSDDPISLELRAAFGVEVRVRSARTNAVVRDVVVVASCSQLSDSRVGGRTDERGIARLYPLFHEDDPRGTWYASLPGVYFDQIRVRLPMEERAAPLDLLLPDSVPAVVRIVDKQGLLCPLSGKLLVGWNDRDGDPAEPRQLRITDGIANLTRIESGLSLHVRAQFPDTSEAPTSVFANDKPSAAALRFDLVLENPPSPAKR